MGMDLFGTAPETEAGRLFAANAHWWPPLVGDGSPGGRSDRPEMPHVVDERRRPGLDRADSKTLGRALRQAVEKGTVGETVRRNEAAWQEAEETPQRDVPARWETRDERGNPRTGMNRQKTLELADFLENCGGFEIW